MKYLTTVPLIFGKGINIWLGLALMLLLALQVSTGLMMLRGAPELIRFHFINGILVGAVATVHAYYGIGVWFFDFTYGD